MHLFKSILKSYIFPKSKTRKFRERLYISIPTITKIAVLFTLTATVLIWMGINNGLEEEFKRFKEDPYTTSILVPSQRFSFAREQLQRMENVRYAAESGMFNFSGQGELIFKGSYPFASVYLVFLQDGEKKIFRGRTLSKADQQAQEAIETYLFHKDPKKDYLLTRDWHDNEKGIIVSRHLLKRLGYNEPDTVDTVSINYAFDLVDDELLEEDQDETAASIIPVPVKVLAVADKMPFGDFIVSNGFYYNYQVASTFNPFDKVEQFHLLAPPGQQDELTAFLKDHFKYIENIVKIDERRSDKKLLFRVDFVEGSSLADDEYEAFANSTAKHFILEKIKNTPFQCADDFYTWEDWREGEGEISPDYLTWYLKEEFVGLLPQLNLFLTEIGVEMDDSIVNIFTNYYEDIARFKRISGILYFLLVTLGILVSVVIYIKSVQASMHRLGVLSTFGVSSTLLSVVLAVESVIIYIFSLILASVAINLFPISTLGISMKLVSSDFLEVLLIGSILLFGTVFTTAKVILKKTPYSLISYRG